MVKQYLRVSTKDLRDIQILFSHAFKNKIKVQENFDPIQINHKQNQFFYNDIICPILVDVLNKVSKQVELAKQTDVHTHSKAYSTTMGLPVLLRLETD